MKPYPAHILYLVALCALMGLSGCVSTTPSTIHVISPNMSPDARQWKDKSITVKACTERWFSLFTTGDSSYATLFSKLPPSIPHQRLSYIVEDIEVTNLLHMKTKTCRVLHAHYIVTPKPQRSDTTSPRAPKQEPAPEAPSATTPGTTSSKSSLKTPCVLSFETREDLVIAINVLPAWVGKSVRLARMDGSFVEGQLVRAGSMHVEIQGTRQKSITTGVGDILDVKLLSCTSL